MKPATRRTQSDSEPRSPPESGIRSDSGKSDLWRDLSALDLDLVNLDFSLDLDALGDLLDFDPTDLDLDLSLEQIDLDLDPFPWELDP